jgi:hypothetical protein
MAKRKGQGQTEELESYLTSDSDVEIYDDLTEGENAGLYEPLEFFRLLYAQFEFAKANKGKPLTVVENLKRLKYTQQQKWYLFDKLCDLIEEDEDTNGDSQLEICCNRIEKERDRLAEKLFPAIEVKQKPVQGKRFDFEGTVKPHLETLPDTKARIKYLYEVKTEYEQTIEFDLDMPNFGKKCDLEIQKQERLLTLERSEAKGDSKDRREKRDKGGTQYQNLLALHYLLHYLRADNNNTRKAKFASFLTGFSENTFRQQWSNVHWLKDKDGVAWEKDMKIVRAFFQELGLSEVAKQIDNDLDF